MSVGVLQLLLTILQLLRPLLLPLQLPDVVHRCLQDGAFVPAHVPEDHRGAIILTSYSLSDVTALRSGITHTDLSNQKNIMMIVLLLLQVQFKTI